jgi:hypothetical protein
VVGSARGFCGRDCCKSNKCLHKARVTPLLFHCSVESSLFLTHTCAASRRCSFFWAA